MSPAPSLTPADLCRAAKELFEWYRVAENPSATWGNTSLARLIDWAETHPIIRGAS